jgi:hypothetical protein
MATTETSQAERAGAGGQTPTPTTRTAQAWATRRPSTTIAQRQRPTLERTTGKGVKDPEAALAEQTANPEFARFRGEMAAQYVENLQIPTSLEKIPGWQLIPNALAQEAGLRGMARGLEGTEDPWDTLDPTSPQPPTAAVDGNTIPSFVDGINGQQKDDVLASTLLAQLAANYRYNRTEDPFNWSNYYSQVLENLAWVVPDSQHRRFESSQARFTMDEVVVRMLAAILTEDAKAILQESIEAVKALRDDSGGFVIFERNSHDVTNGNFMLQPVGVSPAGVLTMTLGSFLFRSTETVTRVLWFSFRGGPNTKVAINRNTLVLNQQVYDQVRETVMSRIVSRISDYIRTVPLLEEPQPEPQPTGFAGYGAAAGWMSLR